MNFSISGKASDVFDAIRILAELEAKMPNAMGLLYGKAIKIRG